MTSIEREHTIVDVTATAADGRSAGIKMIASMEGTASRFVFRKDTFRVADCGDDIHFAVERVEDKG